MTQEACAPLPVCEIFREDLARPPLRRRLKFFGMKTAGRLAGVLSHLPRRMSEADFGILIYHRTAPLVPELAPPSFNVPPDVFREQLVGLQRRGFTFLSLQEVLRRRAANEALPRSTAVITFDDGFESVYEFAWPTLRELSVPATIFINTAYLDNQTPFPFDAWGHAYADQAPPTSYRPLTTDQCREMAATGLIELGAHTHTHADFRGRRDLFRNDMEVCVRQLQNVFGVSQPTFAFPFGKPCAGFVQDDLLQVVREMGLPCALTTEPVQARLTESPYSWGRFNAYEWDNSRTLAAKLWGYYSWAPQLVEGAIHKWNRRASRRSWTSARRAEPGLTSAAR